MGFFLCRFFSYFCCWLLLRKLSFSTRCRSRFTVSLCLRLPLLHRHPVPALEELGQASFGYARPGLAASNLRDGFDNQIGSYAYINPEDKEVRVSYTADSRGFRVRSNNLPVATVVNLLTPVQVQDTSPEVAKAYPMTEFFVAKAALRCEVRRKRQGETARPFPVQISCVLNVCIITKKKI
jgi:hypothetical protein